MTAVTEWRLGHLAAKIAVLVLICGCGDSDFEPTSACDKGTQDCRCIADQHCLEGLVCVNRICLPKEDPTGDTGNPTGEPTTGDPTTGGTTASTGSASTTGTSDGDDSTTTGTRSDSSGSSDSSGGPAGGPYADCHDDPDGCDRGLECLQIDPGGRAIGAMCTSTGCERSGDCDSASDGSAEPFCLVIPPPTDDAVCVLSCAGGAECPEGMGCHNLGLGIEICG